MEKDEKKKKRKKDYRWERDTTGGFGGTSIYEPVGIIVRWASLIFGCAAQFYRHVWLYFVLPLIIHTCGLLLFVSTLLPIKKEKEMKQPKKNTKKICIRLFTIHALPLLCVPATQPASVA